MIEIKDLHAYYGPIEALHGVNLTIGEGITALIGSNGAGKTTLLKSISGIIRRTGSIIFKGENGEEELIHKKPGYMAKRFIIHVPEGRHIFPGLTVEQNLETGTVNWHGFFGNKPYTAELEEVFELFPKLRERRKQLGWSLSGGEQQMLAIGRALMARPKVLMLDEPSMGLAPIVVSELFKKIVEINERMGVPVLLVEQNAKMAMRISKYTYVLDGGRIRMEGASNILREDPRVIETYLGRFATTKR